MSSLMKTGKGQRGNVGKEPKCVEEKEAAQQLPGLSHVKAPGMKIKERKEKLGGNELKREIVAHTEEKRVSHGPGKYVRHERSPDPKKEGKGEERQAEKGGRKWKRDFTRDGRKNEIQELSSGDYFTKTTGEMDDFLHEVG